MAILDVVQKPAGVQNRTEVFKKCSFSKIGMSEECALVSVMII